MSAALITIEHISKRFVKPLDLAGRIAARLGSNIRDEVVHAVDEVSFSVDQGEVVGLVGESGCGKSTLGRIGSRHPEPSQGLIRYRGASIADLAPSEARRVALKVQMIFQDPFASLNPRMRVADIVGEAPAVHRMVARTDMDAYLDEVLARVGLDASYERRYPHQFSGGQRARIGIARALAVKPEFLVCDEAVAALDVSIQAQILNLFMDLRESLALTYLFISHDLGVVEHLADRVVIMYLGRIVESARTEEIFRAPNHPYTQALLTQVPRLEARRMSYPADRRRDSLAAGPAAGLPLSPALPTCAATLPRSRAGAEGNRPGHAAACHLND